jgi:hypothetical protein
LVVSNIEQEQEQQLRQKRIKLIEHFFHDDDKPLAPYKPLPAHTLEQSPCYLIIGKRQISNNNPNILPLYFCKLHPRFKNIYLESIEHHCKYKDPEKHKLLILRLLQHPEEGIVIEPELELKPESKFRLLQKLSQQQEEKESRKSGLRFKCFYCDEDSLVSDKARIKHIEEEHQGKLFYPTQEDFENRLTR